MRTLGIVGGIAPPSTIDYYRQLVSRYRVMSPDGAYPSIVIDSVEANRFFALLEADDRPRMIAFLLSELERLARAGADLGIFASNSPHLVFDEVDLESPIPLVSIVEATAAVAEAQGRRKVGLLGARFTMDGGFYEAVFARHGIAVVVPESEDRAYVHDRYFAELVHGSYRDETRAGMAAVVERMKARDRIEAVVLGGTELPPLFREDPILPVPMLDTTMIHVDAVIARLLA
jgi:aspartate racemase